MRKILNPNIQCFVHEKYVTLYNQVTEKSYRIGRNEFQILKSFVEDCEGDSSSLLLYPEKVQRLLENFEAEKIIVPDQYKEKRSHHLLIWKLRLFKFDRMPDFKWSLLSTAIFLLGIIMPPLLFVYSIYNKGDYVLHFQSLQECDKSILTVVSLFSLLLSSSFHELSHLVVAMSEGVDVPEIGIKYAIVVVWAYVKIIGISSLSRMEKIKIYCAGVVANIILGCCCWIMISLCQPESTMGLFLLMTGLMSFFQAVLNSLFVFKLDGNRILCELLDKEDLRKSAIAFFKSKEKNMLNSCVYVIFLISSIAIVMAIFMLFILSASSSLLHGNLI